MWVIFTEEVIAVAYGIIQVGLLVIPYVLSILSNVQM